MNPAGVIPCPLPCGEASSEGGLLSAGTATQRPSLPLGGRRVQDMTYSGLQWQGRGEDATFSAAYLNTMGPRGYSSSSTPFDNTTMPYGFQSDHSWLPEDFPFDTDYVDLVQSQNFRSAMDMAVYGRNKYGLTAADVMRQSNTLDRNDCSALTGLLSLILSWAITQRQEETCYGCEAELKEEYELGPGALEMGEQPHTCGDEIPPKFFADKANYFYVKHIIHTRLLELAIAHVLGDVFPCGDERRLGMLDCIFENFCSEEDTASALRGMAAHIPPQDKDRFDKAFHIWQSGTCRARCRCC